MPDEKSNPSDENPNLNESPGKIFSINLDRLGTKARTRLKGLRRTANLRQGIFEDREEQRLRIEGWTAF